MAKIKKCDNCEVETTGFIVIEENPAKILCTDCTMEWVEINLKDDQE